MYSSLFSEEQAPSSFSGAPPLSARSPSYQVDRIGRHMRSSKLRHMWTLYLEGEPRETVVELQHSKLTGKKKVLLDGKVVFTTSDRSLRWSWEHTPSQSRVSLHSESGHHELRCEGPGQDATESDFEPSAGRQRLRVGCGKVFRSCGSGPFTPREQIQSRQCHRSCSPELREHVQNSDGQATRFEENVRLQALVGMRDAQIAALQNQLRSCGRDVDFYPDPVQDLVPPAEPIEPASPRRSCVHAAHVLACTSPRSMACPSMGSTQDPQTPTQRCGPSSCGATTVRSDVAPSLDASPSVAVASQETIKLEASLVWDPLEDDDLDITRRHSQCVGAGPIVEEAAPNNDLSSGSATNCDYAAAQNARMGEQPSGFTSVLGMGGSERSNAGQHPSGCIATTLEIEEQRFPCAPKPSSKDLVSTPVEAMSHNGNIRPTPQVSVACRGKRQPISSPMQAPRSRPGSMPPLDRVSSQAVYSAGVYYLPAQPLCSPALTPRCRGDSQPPPPASHVERMASVPERVARVANSSSGAGIWNAAASQHYLMPRPDMRVGQPAQFWHYLQPGLSCPPQPAGYTRQIRGAPANSDQFAKMAMQGSPVPAPRAQQMPGPPGVSFRSQPVGSAALGPSTAPGVQPGQLPGHAAGPATGAIAGPIHLGLQASWRPPAYSY